jgi:hypothetical protein
MMKASGPRIIKGLNSPYVEIDRFTQKFKVKVDAWRAKGGRGKGEEENIILEFNDLTYAELECIAFTIADALIENRDRVQKGLDEVRDRFDR